MMWENHFPQNDPCGKVRVMLSDKNYLQVTKLLGENLVKNIFK